MTRGERRAWEQNIPRLLAEELLRDHRGILSPDELYRALVLTGVDRAKADYERSRRALERMSQSGG
jgi:hypothetical protein